MWGGPGNERPEQRNPKPVTLHPLSFRSCVSSQHFTSPRPEHDFGFRCKSLHTFRVYPSRARADPKPETRNPKPETRNPEPRTRNPKPETRNPKPETGRGVGRVHFRGEHDRRARWRFGPPWTVRPPSRLIPVSRFGNPYFGFQASFRNPNSGLHEPKFRF